MIRGDNTLWIDKRLIKSPIQYHLINDEEFKPSTLKEALENFCVSEKGLHIAIICAAKGTTTELHIVRGELQGSLNDYIEISEDVSHSSLPNGWEKGYYIHYCSLKPSDILTTIVNVIKHLGRDVEDTEDHLKHFEKSFQDPHVIWAYTTAMAIGWVLPEEVKEKGCADIKIVAVMPECAYGEFSAEEYCFPSFVEYVLHAFSDEDLKEIIISGIKVKEYGLEPADLDRLNNFMDLEKTLQEKMNEMQKEEFKIWFNENLTILLKDLVNRDILDVMVKRYIVSKYHSMEENASSAIEESEAAQEKADDNTENRVKDRGNLKISRSNREHAERDLEEMR